MFKESFKYYKSKKPQPDLTNVIDANNPHDRNLEIININNTFEESPTFTGLKNPLEWKIYKIKSKEGLIFIKNPFTSLGHRYWIARCLQDYTKKPQKLNIDAHSLLSENENWWDVCQNLDHNDNNKNSLSKKLRWSTLGYHHNWDTKVYSESYKDVFPKDLAEMSEYVARCLGFENFKAEAAIVNFYHMDSTLSGHTDHSEDNLEAPLLSFSFGQSAIFLIGGVTEDFPAIPIYIHSGDIVIMSKESRLCYHAVPRITPAPLEPWNVIDKQSNISNNTLYEKCKNEIFFKQFNSYIKQSRINVNIRQVLKKYQNKLNR